ELLEVSWTPLGVGRAGAFVFSGRFCGSGCGAGGGDLAAQRFELRRVPGGAVEDSVPSGLATQLGVDACGGGRVGPCGERVVGDAGFVGEPVKVGLDLGVGGHAFSRGVTRAAMGTSRAVAMRCVVMRDGVRCSFATRDRSARDLWVLWARSSRVHPRCSRRARMVCPLTVAVLMPAMLPAV